MKMLEFDSRTMFGTDGSGNQKKIWIDDKHLLKVNSQLREASKEVDACKLAELFGLNHATYKEIKVVVDGIEKNACITENYLYRFVKKIIALNNLIFSIVFFNLCAILK